jgi:hypothetical protein
MLAVEVAAGYAALGMAAFPKPVEMAHGIEVEQGMSCPWGPAEGPAGGADEFYTWALLAPGQAEAQVREMASSGSFALEETSEGSYLIAVSGYEGAFLFTGDVMKFALTVPKLSDITWAG